MISAATGGCRSDLIVPVSDASPGRPDLVHGADLGPAVIPDMEPPHQPDLSVPMSFFCAGTPVAATCAGRFFDQVSLCLDTSGTCVQSQTGYMIYSTCWQNGAARREVASMAGGIDVSWTYGKQTCMTGHIAPSGVYTFTANAQTLSFDSVSGRLTCPDGSVERLPPAPARFGNCPAFEGLISTPNGQCTFTPNGC